MNKLTQEFATKLREPAFTENTRTADAIEERLRDVSDLLDSLSEAIIVATNTDRLTLSQLDYVYSQIQDVFDDLDWLEHHEGTG